MVVAYATTHLFSCQSVKKSENMRGFTSIYLVFRSVCTIFVAKNLTLLL